MPEHEKLKEYKKLKDYEMKKLISFLQATFIDSFVTLLSALGCSYLSIIFFYESHKLLFYVLFLLVWALGVIYLLFTNIKKRSLGFALVGYEYLCEKGKWRIFATNLIYYVLAVTYVCTYHSEMKILFYVSEILWLIDYIGFFIPGINNRFSVHLLGVNFSKRIVEKKDKICI
ncbi:MAG: hypothetical protein IKZ86_14720 [Spirochaetaceae bacterium]|nr:hypothetical protein [Spirochaetaceae bacterium]